MIRRVFDNLEELLGAALLLGVCVVALLRVCSRYAYLLGDHAISEALAGAGSWSVELSTYLFIWMTFVGASLALKKNEHFAIEFVVEKLPGRAAGVVTRISQLLVVVFSLLLIGYGGVQVWNGWNTVTPVLEIPRSVPYAAVPFGGLLMLIRSLEALLRPLPVTEGEEGVAS